MTGLAAGDVMVWSWESPSAVAQRILLHEGTTNPSEYPYRTFTYDADAIVPRGERRRLIVEELAQVVAPQGASAGVCLIRLPQHLLIPLQAAFSPLSYCETEADFAQRLHGDSISKIAATVAQEIAAWATIASSFMARISRPGLPTITDNNGHLIGLHVDNWFGEASMESPSYQRLCVNIGTQSRTLLFVNTRFSSLRKRLPSNETPLQRTALARKLLSAMPSYSVLRLTLPPGFGYIASTEDLIHDASSSDMSLWDVVGYCHGAFDFAAVPDSWRS